MTEKVVEGWVNNVKVLGKIAFLEVIDDLSLGVITVVVKRREVAPETWERVGAVKIGAAVRVVGEEPAQVVSRKGREIHAREIEVLAEPEEPLPVDVTGKTPAGLDVRLDYRYVTLRIPRFRAVFLARARLAKYTREYFESRGFLEVHTPKLVGAGAEGGATLFRVEYFGSTAFLSQSPQLYKQMLMAGVPRVFEVTPYFRAEKFDTPRHLNESWGVDAEMGFIRSHHDVMNVLEGYVRHVSERLYSELGEKLAELGFKVMEPLGEIPRLPYSEAVEIVERRGYKVGGEGDLDTRAERILGEYMAEQGYAAYFIVDYPWSAKPFYIMKGEGGLSRSFDLDMLGTEIASGGQREHRREVLYRNLLEKGLNPNSFKFYLESFKYGMPPHGGFGLGFDRLLMKLLGLDNIREVVLFPRDRFRLVP